MRELAGVILIGIVAAVWLFRWDIEAGTGTQGASGTLHFKLDRFTGTSYVCSIQNYSCFKINKVEDSD